MTKKQSDIDELLEDLRAQRKALSGRKSEPAIDRFYYVDRWIAAVEKLVAFKADQEQSGGHDVLCERHDSGD